MSENSTISWCHHTFNAWSGCSRVSEGCRFCYAENALPSMRRFAAWGANAERKHASEAYWRDPIKWDRAATAAGERHRVFSASMSDVFEARDDLDSARARLFTLIEATPNLDWLLTTKRTEEIMRRVPAHWRAAFPKNVWMIASVEDQATADKRIPELLRVPAWVRGLSMEPLLGPIDLDPPTCQYCGENGWNIGVANDGATPWCTECRSEAAYGLWLNGCAGPTVPGINWIITGGESGPRARRAEVEWFRDIHRQAGVHGVEVHHKQMGAAWAQEVQEIGRAHV